MSGKETQHSSSDQGDSIVSSTNVYSSPGGDAVTHERSTTDWKMYHWILSEDAEVCAVHIGKLMTSRTRMTKLPEPIKAEGNEGVAKRIANDTDESSQRKILTV